MLSFVNGVNNQSITFVEYVSGKKKRKYKFICMKCETTGCLTTKLPISIFGEFYLNDELLKIDNPSVTCPNCGNLHVVEKEKTHYFKTYINDETDKFTINLYGNSYKILAPYKLIEDPAILTDFPCVYAKFEKGKYYKETPPNKVRVQFDFLMNYLQGKHTTPVSLISKGDRVSITINKTSKILLFCKNNQFAVLNRHSIPYYAECIWPKLLAILPIEIKMMIKKIFMDNLHPKNLERWGIDTHGTSRIDWDIHILMYLAVLPNVMMFNPALDFEKIDFDRYTLKKFKEGKSEIEIVKSFIPAISKVSIKYLKLITNHSDTSRLCSSFYLGLISQPTTVYNILKAFYEHDMQLKIETCLYRTEKISFRQAKKILNQYLGRDVLDKQFNDIALSGLDTGQFITELTTLEDYIDDTLNSLLLFNEYLEYLKTELTHHASNKELELQLALANEFLMKKGSYYSVKRLHDDIARINRFISRPNFQYKYSDKRLAYEVQIDDFYFILPKNTNELIRIAVEMDHCVDSYEDYIMYDDCTIVTVFKDDKPLLCLEFSSGQLMQAKKYDNQLLIQGNTKEEDKLIEVLLRYLEVQNIVINTMDLQYINLKEINGIDNLIE